MTESNGFNLENLYSIRELREECGLNQEEFAWLAGISGVYLSQIETGNRPLTDETAEKIAKAFIFIKDDDKNPRQRDIEFTVNELRACHTASFYPKEVREEIIKLLRQRSQINAELNEIYDTGKIPDESFYDSSRNYNEIFLMNMIASWDSSYEKTVPLIKEQYAAEKRKKPRY